MLWGTQGSHLPVPQSVAHLICVPQVPQMWHKMWHNFTNFLVSFLGFRIFFKDLGNKLLVIFE